MPRRLFFAILDFVNMKNAQPTNLAALADETAQVLQALIVCARGGAKPSPSLLKAAHRLRTELLALCEADETIGPTR